MDRLLRLRLVFSDKRFWYTTLRERPKLGRWCRETACMLVGSVGYQEIVASRFILPDCDSRA